MPRSAAAFAIAATVTAGFTLGGCYSPKGGMMPYTGAAETYYSYAHRPATITLVDTRTDEVVFAIDVPAGKQLTIDFVEGDGDDPVYTPDLMLYEVMDRGTKYGKLRNSVTVPSSDVRRIDVSYREGPELPPGPGDEQLTVQQEEDRPEWWTPQGGSIPEGDRPVHIYDD